MGGETTSFHLVGVATIKHDSLHLQTSPWSTSCTGCLCLLASTTLPGLVGLLEACSGSTVNGADDLTFQLRVASDPQLLLAGTVSMETRGHVR